MDNLNTNSQTTPIGGLPTSLPQTVQRPPWFKSKKLWAIIAIILIVDIIALILIFIIIPQNSITVFDQPVKDTISVKEITLTKGGFLVFQAANRYNKPGSFIASTEYLSADNYSDFKVDLYSSIIEQREKYSLKPQDSIFASLYEDSNGTKFFEINVEDKIMRDWFGRPVIKKIRLK